MFQDLKREDGLKDVPVIFVTGASEATGVDLVTGAEADKVEDGDEMPRRFGEALHDRFKDLTPEGLVEKPIDPTVLVAKIEAALGQPDSATHSPATRLREGDRPEVRVVS